MWAIKQDDYNGNPDDAYAYWGDITTGGRLLVNYEFQSNMQIEAEVRVTQVGVIGLNFGGSNGSDGYVFTMDYANRKVNLTNRVWNDTTKVYDHILIATEALPANYYLGSRTKLRVIIHNGVGHCYIGFSNIKAFGGQTFNLSRTSGGIAGIYADKVEARIYMLKVSTTDKWDLMEKFSVEVTDPLGNKHLNTFGAIERLPEYTTNSAFGYLNYSGINELNTRVLIPSDPNDPETEYYREDVSLDYEFFINEVPGYEGDYKVKVIFNDPGIWYGYVYLVDKAGASVMWCGDSYSFLDSMNRAVNEVGAKGIGLWTMGQEDPRSFETIPDVVPYHD